MIAPYFENENGRLYCACGCGSQVPNGRTFISGHNLNVLKRSEAHNQKIGQAQKKSWGSNNRKLILVTFKGKLCRNCHSVFFIEATKKQTKYCCPICFKKHKQQEVLGSLNPFFGKTHSQETIKLIQEKRGVVHHSEAAKQKMSESRKGRRLTLRHRVNISKSRLKDKINYKDNKRHAKHRIRNSFLYRLWREAVFSRDNWTCQCCLKPGGYLEAHHKKPFSTHTDLRFRVSNGETLCRPCHLIENKKQMQGNKNGRK